MCSCVPNETYQEIADRQAKIAGDEHFEERRGIWVLDDYDGRLLIFNNSPNVYRSEELERIEIRLEEIDVYTIAKGGCNSQTVDDGTSYTITRLLDCGLERFTEVSRIIDEETARTWESIGSNPNQHNGGLPNTTLTTGGPVGSCYSQ